MLPSPHGCGLASRATHFRGRLCVHFRCGPMTRRHPEDDSVDGLQVIDFFPSTILATRLLVFTWVGLSPTERASLCWTHKRTCDFQRIRPLKAFSESASSIPVSVPVSAALRLRAVATALPSSAQLRQAQNPPSVAGDPGWQQRSRNRSLPGESPKSARVAVR